MMVVTLKIQSNKTAEFCTFRHLDSLGTKGLFPEIFYLLYHHHLDSCVQIISASVSQFVKSNIGILESVAALRGEEEGKRIAARVYFSLLIITNINCVYIFYYT